MCASNTLGLPSEGEMYRVSSKNVEICHVPRENLLWFGLRLESTMLC